jgi:hypothetical protein
MITAGSNQQRQHGSFAVVRCYRPTRIERELLTQVFDIVHRATGVDPVNTRLGRMRGVKVCEGEASSPRSEHRYSGSLEQHRELEPVA